MAGPGDAARRAPRPALALLVAAGLFLRLWNAGTARVHDDELHYAEDAMWGLAPLDATTALAFLRNHPRDHLRLDPRTGSMRPWGRPEKHEIARLGHPCLLQYVTGFAMVAAAPRTAREAVVVARSVNAVLDAATIVLLPTLAAAVGAPAAAGLVAAALYAVYPPAVCYGSLAYLDPPLAPLLVLLLTRLLGAAATGAGWLALGVITGLFIDTKQVGLIALVLVPAAMLAARPRDVRGLAVWAAATFIAVAAFTNPVAYAEGLMHPSRPIGELRFTPLAYVEGNLALLARPSAYYWLSFARHGEPLASLVARVHPVLTPAVQVAFVVGVAVAAVRRMGRLLLVLLAPAILLLGFVLPSDGLWRFHLLSPLVCLTAAVGLVDGPRAQRAAVVGVAIAAGMVAFLPARPGADGRLDLGDLLRMNPSARQRPSFHDAENPLTIRLGPGTALVRRLWLAPGTYAVEVAASAAPALALDDRSVLVDGTTGADVELHGFVHRLRLRIPAGGTLTSIAVRPVAAR